MDPVEKAALDLLMTPGDVADVDLVALRKPPWMRRAACRSSPSEWFFPKVRGSTRAAKAVCALCTVCDECLAYALADADATGVWGGTTRYQRTSMRRRVTNS
jgi:WhiB family transcriptional regulator, redox-sensing transcriptional regulator